MIHSRLKDMVDELLEDPEELFIESKSKHCALVTIKAHTFLLRGDFSGTPEECEAEVYRILKGQT